MVNRFAPALPAHLRTTYRIAQPLATHTRMATCEEVGCATQAGGWSSLIDESTALGQDQANYIRTKSGRQFTEARTEAGLTDFRFPPGQECFLEHRVDLDRPAFFLREGGDHRGNPRRERLIHSSADAWADDFGSHLEDLSKARE